MIKRAELRTGNLFHNNLGAISILFVREIREDAIIGKELDGVFNGSFDEEDISGVPLTEEWMLKFGFENVDDEIDFSQWRINDDIPFQIFGNGSDKQEPFKYAYEFNHEEKTIEIKYVHQLQNLYFALTGNELTLTPAKEKTP